MKKLSLLLFVAMLSISAFTAEATEPPTTTEAATEETSPLSVDLSNPQESIVKMYDTISDYLTENGVQLLLNLLAAAAVFFIGKFLAKLASTLLYKAMKKGKVDTTLCKFVKNLFYVGMLGVVIITALGALGIPTASFVAVIGAAGLALGLALQGSLSNFAAGVLMIIFKPFKVGDLVEISGTIGVVKEIEIFHTIICSPENLKIIIPNAQATGGNIINYTVNGTRRVDLVIGVSYEDDIKKAKEVMLEVLKADPLVLDDPAPFVGVKELADSSVNYVVRPWCKVADYWDVYFGTTEKVKYALEENGLTIPFPQHDIHMINAPTS